MPESEAKEIKVRYRKTIAFWMTFGVVFLLFICDVFKNKTFQALENKSIDFRFVLRGVRTPKAPIKILAVDEQSLKEIGQWPWPRSVQAQIIQKLKAAGVKCFFYDVFFPEPERTQEKMLGQLQGMLNGAIQGSSKSINNIREKVFADIKKFQETQDGDKELAAAMKEAGNVYFLIEPSVFENEGRTPSPETLHMTPAELLGDAKEQADSLGDLTVARSLLLSIPMLQDNAVDAGHTRCFPFSDGIYRYYPTVVNYEANDKNALIPHLSLQVARHFLDDKNPIKVQIGKYTEVAGRKIPILDNGYAFINYCGPWGTFPLISAADLLKGRVKEDLKGSIVEIGATATGINDIRPTPFDRVSPGANINANIVENVLSNNFLTLAPNYFNYILMLVLAMLMWYLVPRLTPIQSTVVFMLLFPGYVIIACLFFSYLNTVLNLIYPSLAMVLTFLMLTTYKFRTEVRHSRYMKQMFQSMVAPAVVDEIMKLPAGIELGGEEKELTVMFSDIRGFTTYSEKHTPHEVVAILNEYLTQMTNLIFQTEGTLDKYIGDAIMAFWGAPGTQRDHAYRACSTTLGMVDLLHSVLHPKWEIEGKQRLDIGIGLNTGPMVVGFVGSQSIKNYTLIGDAVNLGARLEGTTKEYHVEIIIAESTYLQVKDDMLCRELDLIKVKGKNEPIRIYELIDHRLRGAGMKEMKVKAFEEGLAHYRGCRFDEALKCFKNCLELDPKDGPAEIFVERSKVLKQNPPPAPWDGVFVMKTK